ncbi:MAG: hypothetical protein EOM65_14800 [Synergistales bacterium]|nr:hypothetical protein [Synergistales bacterium]
MCSPCPACTSRSASSKIFLELVGLLVLGEQETAPGGWRETKFGTKRLDELGVFGGYVHFRAGDDIHGPGLVLVLHGEPFAVKDGLVQADLDEDILHLAVINRYQEAAPALGFIKGLGIRKGAIASSVAHDSHNIIVAATDPQLLAEAVNSISVHGGYYATDGKDEASLPLPVAGLMSTASAQEVATAEHRVQDFVRSMGCSLDAPFMTLGFQSLLVIPALKLGDRGLFDSSRFQFVPLLLEE